MVSIDWVRKLQGLMGGSAAGTASIAADNLNVSATACVRPFDASPVSAGRVLKLSFILINVILDPPLPSETCRYPAASYAPCAIQANCLFMNSCYLRCSHRAVDDASLPHLPSMRLRPTSRRARRALKNHDANRSRKSNVNFSPQP